MLENSQKLSSNQKVDNESAVNSTPSINLPKGGGAIRGIDEKFQVNPATGTGSLSIPIFTSPGRQGFSPQLALNYDSGSGNGPFGLGWSLSIPSITRKTDKGIPKYRDSIDSDTFILSGAEDLVPALKKEGASWIKDSFDRIVEEQNFTVQRYRPRIEGLFARIEKWTNKATGEVHWESITKDNVRSIYGKSNTETKGRISDPEDDSRVFKWLLVQSHDDKGNVIIYEYKQENPAGVDPSLPQERNRLTNGNSYSTVYLKRIKYANETPYYPIDNPSLPENWFFEVIFDYGEHDDEHPTPEEITTWHLRDDSFSTFKSGFEIRTQRLCKRVLMFHNFTELGDVPCLVRSTDFNYSENPILTKLVSATQTGYVKNDSGGYTRKSLPPVEFGYVEPEIDRTVKFVDQESLEDLPSGLNCGRYQWVDLDGEGISGILKEEGEGWFYKHNLGGFQFDVEDLISDRFPPDPPSTEFVEIDSDTEILQGKFARAKLVGRIPSLGNLQSAQQQVMDLGGDGKQDLVLLSKPVAGYFERSHENTWENLIPFRSNPGVAWNSPDLRFVDLDGDGHTDIFITQNDLFIWHPSLAKEGFGPAKTVYKLDDEEVGPTLVFSDATQSIYLADIAGDGLTDLVRIRNGEVCYWPGMGYGRFGAKVTMGNSPYFDHPDYFDQNRIRLADIDGSGTTDIIYLGRNEITIWFNQAGNSWRSEPEKITTFPKVDNLSSVTVVDLLGNGTACLVWSSPLPGDVERPMRYIDLMGGKKPHLLVSTKNNMGAETKLDYAPSTKFYLEDKAKGKPWITRLPFPVHALERVEVFDHISKSKFVSLYKYHHGYFDGEEREFRGFGLVEQWDTEHFNQFNREVVFANAADEELHQPPVCTKTWFHTGAYINGKKVSQQFEDEYYKGDSLGQNLPDTQLPEGLTADEEREACRSLKGSVLRQEVYSVDKSEKSEHPYTVVENTFRIKQIQPKVDNGYSVFYTYAEEALTYNYERNPADPRIAHAINLETDKYGNVTKSIAISYPRRFPEYDEQDKLSVLYSESEFTELDNSLEFFRHSIPIESKTYEITGNPLVRASEIFTVKELKDHLFDEVENGYELKVPDIDHAEDPSLSVIEARKLSYSRILYYDSEDLSTHLPFRTADDLAIPYETYQLVFTHGILDKTELGGRITPDLLVQAGYKNDAFPDLPNTLWWAPSGKMTFDPATAKDHLYLPKGYEDPFGEETLLFYNYDLLLSSTVDPIGNTIVADNDYRVLQPRMVTDHNGNRSKLAFDPLGMVIAIAAMGKDGETDPEKIGDDLTEPDFSDATTRFHYDLFNWKDNGKPNYAYGETREEHRDPDTPWQHSYTYCDGFGRELMTKVQAEDGLAPQRDADGNLIRDGDGNVVIAFTDNRWVGTGRTVFNNKGNPVKQYEPFFSPTHEYEDEDEVVEWGVTPIIHYDALSRVIRTELPNGTFSKIEFGPWKQKNYDANDTVVESDWYREKIGISDSTDPEYKAAVKTAVHANTPTVQHFDSLARPFLSIAHNRKEGTDEFIETRTELDIEGNIFKITDDRGNDVMTYSYAMGGLQIYQNSMDAGERWVLTNVLRNPVYAWDSRNHRIETKYDPLQRPTHIWVVGISDEVEERKLVERLVYGESHAEADRFNLKGQLFLHFDGAGVVKNNEFDFKGNLLESSRQIAVEYENVPDWSSIAASDITTIESDAVSLLERDDVFTSSTAYDAINRPKKVISPDNSVYYPIYNEANFLKKVRVSLKGRVVLPDESMETIISNTELTEFVRNIDYDARGQRTFIEYGNGVTTDYKYDKETFRLRHVHTKRRSGTNDLQNLHYVYDPVGNITQIRDDAIEPVYFRNEEVLAVGEYKYDPLYRLIEGTGRESAATSGLPTHEDIPWVNRIPAHDFALRNYSEFYDYDVVGNFLQMRHSANGGGWTRRYEYEDSSNRLRTTNRPGDPMDPPYSDRYTYDEHGNMISMPHLSEMIWDYKDQLKEVNLVGGGRAYYTYNTGGQRVRKVIRRNGAVREERVYLGGFEIYRKYRNGTLEKKMETLHIMDDTNRIAMIETTTVEDSLKVTSPGNKFRYQLSNHLDSSTVELDANANIITYEEYHPYGTTAYRAKNGTIQVSEKRYRYTGMERDEETGLNYHMARHCSTWLGRWVNTDPNALESGINLYEYSYSSPISYTDKGGRQPEQERDLFSFEGARAFARGFFRRNIENVAGTVEGFVGEVADALSGRQAQERPIVVNMPDPERDRQAVESLPPVRLYRAFERMTETSDPEELGEAFADADLAYFDSVLPVVTAGRGLPRTTAATPRPRPRPRRATPRRQSQPSRHTTPDQQPDARTRHRRANATDPSDSATPVEQGTRQRLRHHELTDAELDELQRVRVEEFNLPPEPTTSQSTIVGVLVTERGERIPIHSGIHGGPYGGTQRGGIPRGRGEAFTGGGPSQGNIATHVEGHAAAIMHQRGLQRATLLIEESPCSICGRDLSTALPPKSQLTVVDPHSATTFWSSQKGRR